MRGDSGAYYCKHSARTGEEISEWDTSGERF